MLHLSQLAIGHRGQTVLTAIQLELKPGDLLVLTGGNGSGKSTLLATIAGILAPLAGSMVAPRPLGLVPQVGGLRADLPGTLAEFASLGAPKSAALGPVLDRVGLSERGRQRWARSSGGERQRALIARAVLTKPRLLLLDEAASHLDAAGVALLSAIVAELRAGGGAVIAAVHGDDGLAQVPTARRAHCADGRFCECIP